MRVEPGVEGGGRCKGGAGASLTRRSHVQAQWVLTCWKVPAVVYTGSPLTEVGQGWAPGSAQPWSSWPGPNSNGKWLLSTGYYSEVWKNKQEVFSLQMILVKPQG